MKSPLRSLSPLAGACLFASILAPAASAQFQASATPVPSLSPDEQEILNHMSIVYLDDGQGGLVKTLDISGINVRIINGLGATATTNGLGNPTADDRTGSHNIVAGRMNTFSNAGGLIVGASNTISAPWASVSGGSRNTASGYFSSVSGGLANRGQESGSSMQSRKATKT